MIKLLVGRLTKLRTHSVWVLCFGITTAISADDASFKLEVSDYETCELVLILWLGHLYM